MSATEKEPPIDDDVGKEVEVEVEVEEEEDVEEEKPPCGILGRHPVLAVVGFAILGIGIGVGLSFWDPSTKEEAETKDTLLTWLGLVGDLFIRALKAVVLPLVFINVTLSVVEMMSLGRTSSIASVTILFYLMTTVIASILGVISILCFQGLFDTIDFPEPGPSYVTLGCSSSSSNANAEEGLSFMTEDANGDITCSTSGTGISQLFVIDDVNNTFVKKDGGVADDISMSDTFYNGIFTKLVPSNIFVAFVEGNFAAVVFFAVFFGISLGRVLFTKKNIKMDASTIVLLFKEIDEVLITLINWIIILTPFAVLSLIVKAIGSQENLGEAFGNVGYLMAATIIAMLFHFFIVDVGLLYFFTKRNPFTYLRCLLPAQTTAFACASSAATIPVTLRSVGNTGRVPETIANFVVPLGATVNMDGGAIYFPCACIWLAFLNGEDVNAASYILLVILATVGSAGTAPVPSASLVLIITAYNTVFGTTGTPNGFEFILAIDWFMDRLRTTLNVTGDACVSGMVAAKCGMVDGNNDTAIITEQGGEDDEKNAIADEPKVDEDV
mmetsp:Transcript_29504/g.44679  ORF Transcript_29504/g.44679 Transcript_29504/m.44679 type:complete len:555 (+) Transcript_29504:171-1835(+)|eukprot:CAMPEP_0178928802 /NCGR_PEP_ID=MMETSP0786-20121207/20152_1 /TAXON_ID=186022 /ORGANISM="Thalassionema frauenfeldii, Strain CCMP 1798" /LENGTH=554 /DNA_ID=CAMNT_0020604799 /DNA_START=61 /DNA_END=1725 /DNA_ORIENTATION=-